MKRTVLIEIAASLLMILFLYASVSKWLAFRTFKNDIDNQPFPNELTPWIIYGIPPLMVLITLALIFDRTRKAGFYASLILMMVFTIYSAAVLLKLFAYVPCSCGGIIKNLSWPQNLILNLFFVGISVAGIYWKKKEIRKKTIQSRLLT